MKTIPEVRPTSNKEYWTKIFPKNYKHKNDIQFKDFHIQGDVKLENDKPYCVLCGNTKFAPRMFGNLDVGLELVYECTNCHKGKYRIWNI